MQPTSISAVLVVKNEEKNIENCLKSIRWVDEIIVIDNGSIDNTVKIAKKHTRRVYSRKGGQYDAVLDNKNYGFSLATKKWILSIDADEIITESCKQEILSKIQQTQHNGFYFNFKQVFFGKEFIGPLWTKTKIIRLFRTGKGSYPHLCSHKPLIVQGSIGRIQNPIYHYGYPDIETFINKMNYYTTFDAKLLHDGQLGGLLKKKIKANLYSLFIEPALFLPYYFIIKKNYKDGIHGLVFSILMTFYLFVERAKLWHLRNNKPR